MSFSYRDKRGLIHIEKIKDADDAIINVERRFDEALNTVEYCIRYENGEKQVIKGPELTDDQLRKIANFSEKQRFVFLDYNIGRTEKRNNQKRLRCQYCGRIALTERSTCEGCGAVLPLEID